MYLQGLAHGTMLTAFACALWLRHKLVPAIQKLEDEAAHPAQVLDLAPHGTPVDYTPSLN